MAPSSGHLLVPKVMNAFRFLVAKTTQAVRTRFPQGQEAIIGEAAAAQAIPARIRSSSRHPLHHLDLLRQSRAGHQQTRQFSTAIRSALAEAYPSLRGAARNAPTRTAVLAGRPSAATFGSALRPRLTGGTLPRTAGGYVGIGGRRAFSHVSSSQAHVLSNVSAGVRAFWLGGQRAQFDGTDKRTGNKRFVAVGEHTESASRKIFEARSDADARGTSLEFCIAPELNAFAGVKKNNNIKSSRNGQQTTADLTSAVSPLATDFAKHLAIMAAVHRDLKLLSTLGDLPISEPRHGWISIRFPGCDGRSVERLCDELGVCRGIVREDEDWAEEQSQDVKMALLFPTAPSEYGEDNAAAYFYEQRPPKEEELPDFIMPESLRDGSGSHAELTADETLSPLESLHGSWTPGSQPSPWLSSAGEVSPPASIMSWQPNPWLSNEIDKGDNGSEASFKSTGSYRSADRRAHAHGFQGVSSASQEMENIYQFIAECDGRLGRPTSTRMS